MSFKVVGEVLFGIFSQSHTLSLFLINNPEYIFWLIDNETLSNKKEKSDYYKEVKEKVANISNFEKKELVLRHFRKKEYLRIAAREIIKACSFEETMEELSNLADALVEISLDLAFERYKKENLKDEFSVIGLGKLGNRELNFSSDIDILFVHSKEEYGEIFNRVATLVVNILSQNKGDGFVYRVDTRLRPNGSYSPLSLSVDEYENYYSTFGQLWEKLALIKARHAAGSRKVSDDFIRTVDPFVFKKTIDIEYIDEIRRLMFKIHKSSKKESGIIPKEKQDIKKGKGGIREIEFILNYFQLIYGGKDKQLRKVKTVEGLSLLKEKGFIKKEEGDVLVEAYLFLRRIEHKLQLLNEQQTQLLPSDKKSLDALAKKLDLTLEDFLNRYNNLTDEVHNTFRSIFVLDKGLPIFSTQEDLEGYLEELGIDNAKTIALNIEEAVKKFKASDIKPTEIQRIFDFAFEFTHNTHRFDKVVNGFNKLNPIYIKSVFNNKKLFELFLKLLSIGYAEKFIKNPYLLDSLIAPPKLKFEDLTRKEKERIEFEIVLKLLSGSYNHKDLKVTTSFARSLIKKIAKEIDSREGLCIVGYGKLATEELFIGSDLDLVFVSIDDPYNYELPVRKIVKELKEYYEVDLRLRPFGDKGSLVCDIDYLKKYFERDAQSWEKQAAQRSCIVYSGFDSEKIKGIIHDFAINTPPSKCDIFCMLDKIVKNKGKGFDIKSSLGGLTSIDFLVQAVSFEKNVAELSKGSVELLDKLKENGIEWAEKVKSYYITIFKVMSVARSAGLSSKLDMDDLSFLGFLLGDDNLAHKLNEIFEYVRSLVREYFYDCSCN